MIFLKKSNKVRSLYRGNVPFLNTMQETDKYFSYRNNNENCFYTMQNKTSTKGHYYGEASVIHP